jgi:hypothetical protein
VLRRRARVNRSSNSSTNSSIDCRDTGDDPADLYAVVKPDRLCYKPFSNHHAVVRSHRRCGTDDLFTDVCSLSRSNGGELPTDTHTYDARSFHNSDHAAANEQRSNAHTDEPRTDHEPDDSLANKQRSLAGSNNA